MTLCWTLDKLGPIARSVEDCALVLGAIHGADGQDPAAVDRPFNWPGTRPLKELRVGYFDGTPDRRTAKCSATSACNSSRSSCRTGASGSIIGVILDVEAAAAFDDITREGVSEGIGAVARPPSARPASSPASITSAPSASARS